LKCCDNCGIEAPDSQQQGSYIDYGWSLNWLALGHYGGFTDCLPEGDYEFDSPRYLAHLCHDCCIKLLNVLPGLAKLIFPQDGGGHPNMNDHDSEDGTLTPTGKKLRGTMQTYRVNKSNQWEVWVDREFISLNDSVKNNPWDLST
jgi:hypothetical protein